MRVTTHNVTLYFKHVITWGYVTKSKSLNLPYYNAYGHQTCQGGDILLGASSHKFIWSLSYVILSGHVTNWIRCISICRRPKTRHETRQSHDLPWKAPSYGLRLFTKRTDKIISPLMATKFGMVLTSGKRLKTQTPKSSLTSCSFRWNIIYKWIWVEWVNSQGLSAVFTRM